MPLGLLLLVILTKSTGVTHWKLQDGVIKAVVGDPVITDTDREDIPLDDNQVLVYDKELYLLTANTHQRLIVISDSNMINSKPLDHKMSEHDSEKKQDRTLKLKITQHKLNSPLSPPIPFQFEPLTCGDPVDFTAYDFLEGVARRYELPSHSEPEVAVIFKKSPEDTAVDLIQVEIILREAFEENPTSVNVLNQIGNLWRIKGNTQYAIDCFRQALALDSTNSDVLLNLGRVLFNLNFVENSIFLTKMSLHHKQPRSATWLQHYTLGEAYKTIRKYEEASLYFRKALELNPAKHSIIEIHLREIEDNNRPTNIYTVVIILILIMTVLGIMYYILCIQYKS